jgi:hypothetical protein
LLDGLRSRVSGPQQRFVSLEIRPRPLKSRTGICQGGLRLRDFCRLACSFEIGQLLFGLRELSRRLVARSAFAPTRP